MEDLFRFGRLKLCFCIPIKAWEEWTANLGWVCIISEGSKLSFGRNDTTLVSSLCYYVNLCLELQDFDEVLNLDAKYSKVFVNPDTSILENPIFYVFFV